jgi:hypothetical protein
MAYQTKPWRYHLPIMSLAPRRARRDGLVRRCAGALLDVLTEVVSRLRRKRPTSPVRRPEPPPIRWEM